MCLGSQSKGIMVLEPRPFSVVGMGSDGQLVLESQEGTGVAERWSESDGITENWIPLFFQEETAPAGLKKY